MRVLVTGGAGYLGSVLCRELLLRGHEVTALDALLYGSKPLRRIIGRRRFGLIRGNVCDRAAVGRAVGWADGVVHLAAIVGDPAGQVDPKVTVETNLDATRYIAETCKTLNKRLVFASTCSVYGAAPGRLLSEKDGTERPVSLYGQTKLDAERAILECGPEDATVLRMGTLFGDAPRRRFDLVANLFIAKAMLREPLRVTGGAQSRPFLHVADAAEAYADALENGWTGVLNIASQNVRIDDLAAEISLAVEPPARVVFDGGSSDPRDYRVDCGRARGLGFNPSRDFGYAVHEFGRREARESVAHYAQPEFHNAPTLRLLWSNHPVHGIVTGAQEVSA